MEITENQEFKDISKTGRDRKWKERNCRILSMQNVWKYWDIRLLRMRISVQKS